MVDFNFTWEYCDGNDWRRAFIERWKECNPDAFSINLDITTNKMVELKDKNKSTYSRRMVFD